MWLAAVVVVARWLGGRMRLPSRARPAGSGPGVLAAPALRIEDRIDRRPRWGRRSHRGG
jgi:hypothetical protein